MDPFTFNFITESSFHWLKGFHSSPKVNEPEDGYSNSVYHTAYLRNERGDPHFFFLAQGSQNQLLEKF